MRDSRESSPRRVFWAALWLSVMLVALKAYYLGSTTFALVGGREFFRWTAAISYADVLFAAVLWVGARAILTLTPTRAKRNVAAGILIAGALVLLHGAASMVLFGPFGGFPTYPLLVLAWHIPMIRW